MKVALLRNAAGLTVQVGHWRRNRAVMGTPVAVLEREEIPVDYLAGTSIGGVAC